MQAKIIILLVILLLFGVIESHLNNFFGRWTRVTENVTQDDDELIIDNSIDQNPTYLPPAERWLKIMTGSLKNLSKKYESKNHTSRVGKIISGVAVPFMDIFKFKRKMNETTEKIGRESTTNLGNILNSIREHFQTIYPGTLWCGAGNLAGNEEEIGYFESTDSCCRNHDRCPATIIASSFSGKLRNDGVFTRSHCDCDDKFYKCLKSVENIIARKIGFTYFTLLRPQCFKEEYPATCSKYGHWRIARAKCEEYDMDTTKNKTMQWFDNPDF